MNKIVIALLLCLPFLGNAQETKKKNRWEIGLNGTQLLRNLFAQNPSGETGRHTFFVKTGTDRAMFRLLVGGHVRNRSEDFDGTNSLIFNSSKLDLGLGFERRRQVYKKLELVVGFDVLTTISEEKSTNRSFGFPDQILLENTRSSISLGVGPILGLRYAFSDFFAVSTESNIYLLATKGINKTTQDGNELTNKEFSKLEAIHTLPTNLFVVLTF